MNTFSDLIVILSLVCIVLCVHVYTTEMSSFNHVLYADQLILCTAQYINTDVHLTCFIDNNMSAFAGET